MERVEGIEYEWRTPGGKERVFDLPLSPGPMDVTGRHCEHTFCRVVVPIDMSTAEKGYLASQLRTLAAGIEELSEQQKERPAER